MKRYAILIFIIGLSTMTAAHSAGEEHVDTAVFASTSNYPDAFLSKPVSEKIGAPVMLTERNDLPEKASNALEKMEVEEAVVFGGPEVISESTEQDIESEVEETTRLWGTTQIGTSVEISEYFWPESDEAVIVQDTLESDRYSELASIAEDADESPVLISKEGTLSAKVLSEIDRLGATEITVYSDNRVNVTQDLEEVGVEEVEIEDMETNSEGDKKMFVAAPGFREALTAASSRGSAMIIRSEDMIQNAVEAARQTSEEEVYVTGEPELASSIADSIRQNTEKEVELVTGTPEEVSANLTSREAPEWSDEQNQKLEDWRNQVESSPGLERSANKSIVRAESVVDENSPERVQNMLSEAKTDYENGDYFEARRKAVKAHSSARSSLHSGMSREEVRERVQEEREDLREATRELSELGQEQAMELQEAESVEERLEIVREYREERRDMVEELRESRRENTERRERTGGERFRQEPGESGDIGTSDLKIEVDGNELEVEAEYTASTGGYTRNVTMNREGSEMTFDINLNSPEGLATQVVTDLRVEKTVEVEDGDYSVKVNLIVDGETIRNLERQVEVPSNESYESDSDDDSDSGEENIVRYTDSGFQPEEIEIERGEYVIWLDESSNPMWIGSDEHPTHENYDGTSLSEHCEGDESDTFDQCSTGERYEYEFEKTGEFGYHNHEADSDTGKVIVE